MAGLGFTRALGLSAMLLVAACSATKESSANRAEKGALLPGDRPVAYAVHSADLLAAMAELENLTLGELSANLQSDTGSSQTLTSQTLPSAAVPSAAVPSDALREAQIDEVERIADTLAASVATLPDLLASTDLPADRKLRFLELTDQLRRDALSLRDRAAFGGVESAREEREVLIETCNACHAEFRRMPAAAGDE